MVFVLYSHKQAQNVTIIFIIRKLVDINHSRLIGNTIAELCDMIHGNHLTNLLYTVLFELAVD